MDALEQARAIVQSHTRLEVKAKLVTDQQLREVREALFTLADQFEELGRRLQAVIQKREADVRKNPGNATFIQLNNALEFAAQLISLERQPGRFQFLNAIGLMVEGLEAGHYMTFRFLQASGVISVASFQDASEERRSKDARD